MGYIRDMFRTAGEVSTLTRQLEFSQSENERLVWQVTELDKAVKAERASKDRFVNKFCDQLSKQHGLPMKFDDKPEPKPIEKEPLTAYQEMRIEEIAKQMIAHAEMMNDEVPSFDDCIAKLKSDLPALKEEGLIS